MHPPSAPTPRPAPTGFGTRRPGSAELLAAAASAGAGLVHAAAAGSHGGETTLTWLFACTAAAQLGWAAWIVLRPSRGVARLGVLLNGAAAVAWIASRTVGLFGPLADVEAVGTQDLLAALLGAVAAGAAWLAARTLRAHDPAPAHGAFVGIAAILALALAVPAMATEHTHGDHEHGATVAATDDHGDHDHGTGQAAATHDHGTTDEGAADAAPITALDDPRLTKQQRRAATALLTSSRATLARYPDEAAVVAAGYRSIGDGRSAGSFEHFVNPAYMGDGRELDPDAVESIVLQKQPDGTKRVMSAMYILEPGKTMADVPDIAGSLTTWHDHQNLCWDASGTRLAGVLRDGVCVPGGTFRATPPMIHVWADDPVCGPFTGIEGHGGESCEHTHGA